MSTSPAAFELLLRPASTDTAIDRKALAGVLLEIARSIKPELREQSNGIASVDLQLEQLRTLLVGKEIETLARLRTTVEDPEHLATAIGRVLPGAIAQATTDARMGHVLAPVMEKATESSVRSDPGTLVNILYPLIVPAIRKSVGEMIDETFQSLNESLKHSLTLRGLKWRWEALRTGVPFAEVVLRHTLVYQVEHVFLIHRHTGLLIAHVAAPNAASQDPQLVSSMLVAIQDFVKDSFSGAEQQGLDALRLGELRLWSEQGPFATLVAVIRGDPPEVLHETLRNVLSRIHSERYQALQSFDGDSSGFADVEAQLNECVALQEKPRVSIWTSVRRTVVAAWIAVAILAVLAFAGRSWWEARTLENYVAQLRAQPGIQVSEWGRRDGNILIVGSRDPLAIDPDVITRAAGLSPDRVTAIWAPYQALDPEIVLKRLRNSLDAQAAAAPANAAAPAQSYTLQADPSSSVTLALKDGRIVAEGGASAAWLERARAVGRLLPQGAPGFDLSAVRNADEADDRRWDDYVAKLRTQSGIVVTQAERRGDRFVVAGLRDPLAADPAQLLRDAGVDPARVGASWAPYQSLEPEFMLKRLQTSLEPPPTVSFANENGRIVARGTATPRWLERARLARRMLPAGAPDFDYSAVQNVTEGEIGRLRQAIQSRIIRFDNNVSLPAAGQDGTLDEVATRLKELASLSASVGVTTRVMLTGHADAVGQGTSNLSLSVARAEAVRSLLRKRGVDPELLQVRGAGQLEPLQEEESDTARSANRRVSFTVTLEEQS